jgi:surface antigen
MQRKATLLLCVAVAGVLLAGCEGRNNQALATGVGTVAGGVAGALLGRQLGGRNSPGALIGGLVGAAMGGLLTNHVAHRLSAAERWRQNTAHRRLLEAPVEPDAPLPQRRWVSPEDPTTRGTAEVLVVTDGGQCRTIREIAYVRGEELRQEARFCRGENGQWTRQA